MPRITVSLDTEERAALYQMATAELRGMREQARWLIRQGLERRGWLSGSDEGAEQMRQEMAVPGTRLVSHSREEAAQ